MAENGHDQTPLTSAEENARIAKLTSSAITASSEKLIADVSKTIEAAEATAAMLRLEADNLIADIRKHTEQFAARVSTYVDNCHQAAMIYRDHHERLADMPNAMQEWKGPNNGLPFAEPPPDAAKSD